MRILNLLFDPNGRLNPRDFLRGAILLTGFLVVSMVIEAYAAPVISGMFSILTTGTIYCYLCVYGKRLHDNGRSAWYFIAFLLGFLVLSNVLNGFLVSGFAPQAVEITEEMMYLLQRGETREAMQYMSQINQLTIIPRMVTLLAVNAALAYAGARLSSDPVANQYGAPTSSGDIIL